MFATGDLPDGQLSHSSDEPHVDASWYCEHVQEMAPVSTASPPLGQLSQGPLPLVLYLPTAHRLQPPRIFE